MGRAARIFGTLLLAAGLLGLGWTITVWRWQDPITALYTHYEQAKLGRFLDRQIGAYHVAHRRAETTVLREERLVAAAAAAAGGRGEAGQAIGRGLAPRHG